jgi:hypothetical protein
MSQDKDKVKEIIEESGNTFHFKVLKYLQEKGWKVLISPYYNDHVSGKPREIDLVAEKEFPVYDIISTVIGTINIKLFIECKYINQKTVFWFHDKDKAKAKELLLKTTLLKEGFTDDHHYLGKVDSVAKLFADERKRSPDNEIFYKALNQSLNAMVYFRDIKSINEISNGKYSDIQTYVYYPIIICNSFDDLYKVKFDTVYDPLKNTEGFLLEVNYAYIALDGTNTDEYFLIDILNFDLFDSFFQKIDDDVGLFYKIVKLMKNGVIV